MVVPRTHMGKIHRKAHAIIGFGTRIRCLVSARYLGDMKFIVETAENSKLKVGNTFLASLFILGEPLYLSDLVQGNNPPMAFVVGNKDGLCELKTI